MPKFRLRFGVHNEGGKTYYPGDVIDSASDLSKHNERFGGVRFEPIAGGSSTGDVGVADSPQGAEPSLNSLTVARLKQLASELEVDLGEATRKDDIVEALQEAGVTTVDAGME